MLVAVAAFAGMDATLKMLASSYPPMQIGALRGAASLPFLLAAVALWGRWADLRPVRIGLHLLRGVLAVAMMVGFIYAVKALSLANAYSIFFVAPLLVTALAVPLLGERVERQRWVAIAVGLGGVLTMLQPGQQTIGLLGMLGALVAATAYALSAITVRMLTRTDSTAAMVFWFLVLLTLFCGVIALPGWVRVQPEDWPWIAVLGLLGIIGQHFVTEAFRHAAASVVAPFEYTALLWAMGIDWVVWSVLPEARALLGGSLVISSGLYLIWREHRLNRSLAAELEASGNIH